MMMRTLHAATSPYTSIYIGLSFLSIGERKKLTTMATALTTMMATIWATVMATTASTTTTATAAMTPTRAMM